MEINKFGNTSPPASYIEHPYLLNEEPFNIVGNIYFVGNSWCSSHLIDTGKGLILLDTPCAGGLPYIMDSIWRLGFNPEDIKYVIVTHAHVDHFGCVKALVNLTGAKTFMGKIEILNMKNNPDYFSKHITECGGLNDLFEADVALQDGDSIELGNTKIRCVLTPGHTLGTMSYFWDLEEEGKRYKVGIFGGAGFASLSPELLKKQDDTHDLRELFVESIQKVWDEEVDIMLGNHPVHNDLFEKHHRYLNGDIDAFIDPTEWKRFLQELKDKFSEFIGLSQKEIDRKYEKATF